MIAIVGDLNVDVICKYQGDIAVGSDTAAQTSLHLGGSPCNVAAWLATTQMAFSFYAAIGDDMLGDWVNGIVGKGTLIRKHGRTGSCVILVSADGQRTMFPDPGVNLDLAADDILPLPAETNFLMLSAYSFFRPETRALATDLVREAKKLGIRIAMDAASAAPILHTGVEQVRVFLGEADFVLANADEAAVLGLDWLATCQNAIVKRGSGPITWYSAGSILAVHEPLSVTVLDSTGAGDAFSAGWLSVVAEQSTMNAKIAARALEVGAHFGALACAKFGAQP